VRPATSSLEVARLDGVGYELTLHVPDARVVELSGDFNGWQPVVLHQTRPDVWETTLSVGPGTYHVNVRVNGDRWVAPPGLVTIADEFNGTVGLLILR
jgi:1,4-alpha-glucan branching enzyme